MGKEQKKKTTRNTEKCNSDCKNEKLLIEQTQRITKCFALIGNKRNLCGKTNNCACIERTTNQL